MPSFTTCTSAPYSARQMYDLVADVEKYPEFLPLCDSLAVRQRRQDAQGNEVLIADMTVAYTMFRESFTTRVLLKPVALTIETAYVDGPFEHLENIWRFDDTDTGADCHFFIDYEFRSKTLGMVMAQVFDRAFRRFSDAFRARADDLYGAGGTSSGG